MKYTEVKNPKWANAEQTLIDCDVNFSALEDEFVPFTASPNDSMPHGVEIFERAVAGEFGVVASFTPLEFSDDVWGTWVRDARDAKLTASDWTQLPDVPAELKAKWAPYRQSLRDITLQQGFPHNVVWPDKP